MRFNLQGVDDLTDKILLFFLGLIVISLFWSPYFTPPNTIGAAGILRLDQILLLLFIVVYIVTKRSLVSLPRAPSLAALTAMTAIIFVSFLTGLYIFDFPWRYGDFFDFFRWITYVIFVIIVLQILSNSSIHMLVAIILFSGVSVAVLGIFQFYDFLGIHQISGELYLRESRFDRWGTKPDRAYGTTPNPNMFAQLLSLPLLLSTSLSLLTLYNNIPWEKKIIKFITLGFSTAVLYYAMFLTYSRTGMILVGIGIGFILTAFIKKSRFRFDVRNLEFGILIVFVGGFVLLNISELDLGRYTGLFHLREDSSLQQRFEVWETVIPIISNSPLIGHGPSRYGLLMRDQYGSTVDSGILRWWYHYGVLGVITILGFFIYALRDVVSILIDRKHFYNSPLIWSVATAAGGWILGALLVWLVLPVLRYDRSFLLFLIMSTIIIYELYRN